MNKSWDRIDLRGRLGIRVWPSNCAAELSDPVNRLGGIGEAAAKAATNTLPFGFAPSLTGHSMLIAY
jgi:hypothetical protein